MLETNSVEPIPVKESSPENDSQVEQQSEESDRAGAVRFTQLLNNWKDLVSKTSKNIAELQLKISSPESGRHAEVYARQLADAKRSLLIQSYFVEFMRFPSPTEDVEYRVRIMNEFAQQVKEVVPDTLHLVFHGTSNIGTVREIIGRNGLLTPEEKGESVGSTASKVDATTVSSIQVSCEFAEPGISSYMPYGAIFAFFPKQEEVETVIASAGSTQVMGGVDGVDFMNEPERLHSIITTPENIPRVKAWCEQFGLDSSKVMTHGDFLKQVTKTTGSA